MIWLQVRDVHAEHVRLHAAGVRIIREPVTGLWDMIEMWVEDPDGIRVMPGLHQSQRAIPQPTLLWPTFGPCGMHMRNSLYESVLEDASGILS